jgi:hypothetical protein
MARSSRSRRLPGLTTRQSDALRQIDRLTRNYALRFSYLSLADTGDEIARIETLLRRHFGLTWEQFAAAGMRTEARALAG